MIKILIHKVSLPDTYTKKFDTVKDAVIFIRERQCDTCMKGEKTEDYTYPDLTECYDLIPFFSTACGCEFEYELIDEE